MFERIRAVLEIWKTIKLIDILGYRGAVDETERAALVEIISLYFYGGIRKKEEFYEHINNFYDFLCDSYSEKESLEMLRRAPTRLVYSPGFRERIFDFCLDYLIPFSENKSFFEIYKLHKKYATKE